MKSDPDVVVVGAGVAGQTAAQALVDQGQSVLVLEASDYVGGRCVTDITTFNHPFDRGGSWLHAASINPLAHIAEKRGIALAKDEGRMKHLITMGHRASKAERAEYEAYFDEMWGAINGSDISSGDRRISDAVPPSRWRDVAELWVAQSHGAEADKVSLADAVHYDDGEGNWLVQGGLGAFIRSLHRDLEVVVNCPVSAIDYTGPTVRLTTPKGTVTTTKVILTVSTGVLATDAIRFSPPLPQQTQQAVRDLPMGLLNKVGIEFAPDWDLANEADLAEYHVGADQIASYQFRFFDTPLAVAFTAGRFADELERQGPGAQTDFVLEGLRAFFGSNIEQHIVKTSETAWRQHPFSKGAYSYALPGKADSRAVLRQAVDEKLYFAGEAVMTESYSTVHGAYLSGLRAAGMVYDPG